MTTRRVIFLDPRIWTHKEHLMPNCPVNRRLTDGERELLAELTVWVVAEQTGWTDTQAAEWLEHVNDTIGLHRQGDNIDVTVTTGNGHTILQCTREWLTFQATHDEVIEPDEIRNHVRYHRGDNQ
ncbi:hypothetical protein NIIDNTM18_49790 [Mycolicibacterium litorale]|uniref:Uncharacterized protein n=1 Tax=Mycolicibacterium litorale TaxID=758802 RepID=A0A6S6PDA9_9MYCO|nr:hypothetical protein [Mycolicibacterium litorale]BCI55701.1 hypothetical protein NIIDNTM18_49790 [Mycolicibacterium litorale]